MDSQRLGSRLRNRRDQSASQDRENLGSIWLKSTSSNPNKLLRWSKFLTALTITVAIIVVQLLVFHFHLYRGSDDKFRRTHLSKVEHWDCLYPGISHVHSLARNTDVELVIVDPDLVNELFPNDIDPFELAAFKSSSASELSHHKRSQESSHKTIVHLAVINETSGGQPNIMGFYNDLKANGYIMLKYTDDGQTMKPEVYHGELSKLDHHDASILGKMFGHDDSHDPNIGHEPTDLPVVFQKDLINKIYTEFITHIFILNKTLLPDFLGGFRKSCKIKPNRLVVIHIVVLYNFDYAPANQWLQPKLEMDELDRHKLLGYSVHSFDMSIPTELSYLHNKRNLIEFAAGSQSMRVFEDRQLNYANNSYLHCRPSRFVIGALIGDTRKLSNNMKMLDNSMPLSDRNVQDQIRTSVAFMDTYSKTYGNFSFWITGASLLSYYKHCQLAMNPYNTSLELSRDILINLDFGIFAKEIADETISDLAEVKNIGLKMLSDWTKPNSLISFQLQDCPNIIFNLYIHDMKRDFYEYYYSSRVNMIAGHKFRRRASSNWQSSSALGHHIFRMQNMILCWTTVGNIQPIRVPCDVHDHLRRIYLI